MAKISIIIPTYGKPMFLERAVLSVQKQTFDDWELFVVDDNNPDSDERKNTEDLLQSLLDDSRIHYLKHPRNLNGAVARNTGLEVAIGKYIAFLDNDDGEAT